MQTYLGYPISQLYWYIFVNGMASCACIATLGYTVMSRGFNLKRMTLLQYGCAVFGVEYLLVSMCNVAFNVGNCAGGITATVGYTLQDISTDSVLTTITIALILPGGRQKLCQYLWIAAYVILDILPHIANWATMHFTWMDLGDGTGICIVIQNPTIAVPGTLLKIIFLAAIGISMISHVFRPKSDTVKEVGAKGVIFAVLLIAVKLGLFIPYCLDVGGPILASGYCVVSIGLQTVLVAAIIAMKAPGLRTTFKSQTAKTTSVDKKSVLKSKKIKAVNIAAILLSAKFVWYIPYWLQVEESIWANYYCAASIGNQTVPVADIISMKLPGLQTTLVKYCKITSADK
ncbi:hypothetical protein HDV06_004041 [Boothiomyces sp. JEL0866]|nr:hypothetical protein HDV06_004041 [Boothiomyces sp. JEL0866]